MVIKAAAITAAGLLLIGLGYMASLFNMVVPAWIAGIGGVLIVVGSAIYFWKKGKG